jgi:hypothetical protein
MCGFFLSATFRNSEMTFAPLRLQHGLLFVVLAVLFFAWGAWLMRAPAPAVPLPWLAEWQSQRLPALAAGQLSLAQLRSVHASDVDGELWLASQPSGAQLQYRAALGGADDSWSLLAVLELSASERDSLVAAAGFSDGGEQPLSPQLLDRLASLPVRELQLTPTKALAGERLAATLGPPRVRLQLENGEAWVYPTLGLTARLQDATLLQLYAVPKRAMQH